MGHLEEKRLTLATTQPIQFIDITDQVASAVNEAGIKEGLLLVMSQHTTGAVVINENCVELQRDMVDFLQKLVPAGQDYRHDRIAMDGRPNTHSHLMSLLMTQQVTVPIVDGRLQIGTWQRVFFVELDGPRPERKVSLSFIYD